MQCSSPEIHNVTLILLLSRGVAVCLHQDCSGADCLHPGGNGMRTAAAPVKNDCRIGLQPALRYIDFSRTLMTRR